MTRYMRLLAGCLWGGLLGFVGLSLPARAQTLGPGEWTWIGGSSTVPSQLGAQPGVYGNLGTPAPGNTPGGREYALSWIDNNGNLWLFGGLLFSNQSNYFNDLWKFDPVTSEWAWISGSNTVGSNCPVISTIPYCGRSGTYGTLGTPAAGNTPGGRYQAETWVDLSGNFWLYGGLGFDANGNWGALNDLWRFNPSTNQWTWMGSFNSTSPVSITGNAVGTGTLTIVTTASFSPTCTSSNQMPSGVPWHAESGAALASLFLLIIPKRGRTWRSMLSLMLLFMALVGGVVACGGNGGGVACPNVVTSGTTPGTYIIGATGTSGAITKTGTVTVTVQ
jgi:hypothetical protein